LTNGIAGALALWIGDVAPSKGSRGARDHVRPPRVIWLAAAGTGCLGIGLEILWTTLFAQVLHNSVYSFAAVSLVFLLAIAAGAAIAAVLLRAMAPSGVAAVGLIVSGVASIAGVWIFFYATDNLRYFGMERGLLEYVGRIIALAAVTAGPGTVAAGGVLPALWAAFGDHESVTRPVGGLTAANLVGGIVGALAAAFLVLPSIGLRSGFLVAAVTYLVLGAAMSGRVVGVRRVAYASVLAVVALDPLHLPLAHLNAGEMLRATAEGASGVLTVVDTGDDLQLRLDNYYVLGGTGAEQNERRQGLVPLLVHPDPLRVAFIGMATGISASAAAALNVPDLTVIEVVPQVAAMALRHFGRWNGHLLERPDVRLVLDDGRRHLSASRSRFDVIVSDLFIPWHASAGNLYSIEMYETVARRLAPQGLFCQWLPLYQLTREEFNVIARTFLAVFPHVTLWRNDFYPDRPVVGLVGAARPIPLDLDRVGRRLEALQEWGRDSLLGTPRALAMLYLGDISLVSDLFATAPLNHDDRPVIEFLAPRLTRMSAAGDKDWFTGRALADFTDGLAARLAGTVEPGLPPTEGVAEARRAGAALFRYAIAARAGDATEAERRMIEVRHLVPEVVASAAPSAPFTPLADARRSLDTLRSEQERLQRHLESIEQRLGSAQRKGEHRP
jgi:spermidine synthase